MIDLWGHFIYVGEIVYIVVLVALPIIAMQSRRNK